MPAPLAYMATMGGISAIKQGLGFLQQESVFDAQDEANRKAYNDKKRQVQIANAQESARVERANTRIRKIWDMDLQRYQRQLQMNREAAERGYIGEQMGAMDSISAFMFQQQDLLAELTRSAGESAARGYTSRASELATFKDTYGGYHRNRFMSAANLGRSLGGTQGAMDQISRDEYQANLNAHAEVAIAPELEVFRPTAMPSKPKAMDRSVGLRIGNAAAQVAMDTASAFVKGGGLNKPPTEFGMDKFGTLGSGPKFGGEAVQLP